MAADYFRLFVIGHDLEAKCDVANALIKDKATFKQFSCRRRFRVQPFAGHETISGLQYVAVLTPNLHTPAWTHLKSEIKMKFKHYAFLYVKDNDRVIVNHGESIANIKREFPRVLVHMIDYISLESSVGTGSFYKRMDFSQKIETAKTALIDISQAVANNLNIPYKGHQEVEGRKKGEKKADPRKQPKREHTVPATHKKDKPEKTEKRLIELPKKLDERHWHNYSNTLKCGRAKSNLVRVNVVGNQSAGKTTLTKLLQGLNVTCPDTNQMPTEALDVTEITSRCSEMDGIKQWETKEEGYEDELNVQRMAEAMNNTINAFSDVASDTDEPDYVFSSAIDDSEDTVVHSLSSFSNMAQKDNRDMYLKKIVGRLNATAAEDMYITYWDFAGQTTYYAAHQVFLSHSAVYILVVDLSLDFDKRLGDSLTFRSTYVQDWSNAESLVFWVSSIKAFTADTKGASAPILIVGTHKDQLKPKSGTIEEMINAKFDRIKDVIKMSDVECIAIDNTRPDEKDLQAIRNRVLELGLGVTDEMIPAQWIDLERTIEEQKIHGRSILSFDDLRTLDKGLDMPIRDDDRLEAFLGHQHCRGQLMHFPHKDLKNIIILHPGILAKFLNSLMRKTNITPKKTPASTEKIFNHNGIINHAYIKAALAHIDFKGLDKYVADLIKMLISLSIIHPYKSEQKDEFYLMPCLLPKRPEMESTSKPKESRAFQIKFPNDTMSSTFFYHLLAKLLRRWPPVEPDIGKPELFNLYACFRLKSDAQQLEVKWGQSHIQIDINNFSTKTKLADLDLWNIVEVLRNSTADICHIYRHITTGFEIKVQCPKHTGSFVSLKLLQTQDEAMCFNGTESHTVDADDVFNRPILDKANQTVFERRPTDRDLGRIAMFLGRDSSAILASRARLYMGNVVADNANMATKDKDYRRFIILERWRNFNISDTLGELLDLVTETGDYAKDMLINRLKAQPKQHTYNIPDTKLDSVPYQDPDILAVSECIGRQYPLLALELGLSYETIEQSNHNKRDLLNEVVFELLSLWRKDNPEAATTRVLLDTARFIGINTDPIEKRLRPSRRP